MTSKCFILLGVLIASLLNPSILLAQDNKSIVETGLTLAEESLKDTMSQNRLTDNSISENVHIANHQEPLDIRTISETDSVMLLDKMRLNPKKAGLYSALFPGGGQIYNKEYWKLSIVYAALGTGVAFIIHNNSNYNSARLEYSKRLSLRTDLNDKYSRYNMYQLQQEQDYYKEYLDLSVLLTSIGYILQIMDAVAFNHLKGFDISPDISMRFKMSELYHNQVGIGIAFSLK